MVNLSKKIFFNFRVHLRRIAFEGVGLTIFLVLIIFVLTSNIFRVIEKGRANYDIFKLEQESLAEIKERNQNLRSYSELVKTDEYLILLARDVLGLAKPNENLFKTKEERLFFEVEKKYLSLDTKEDYSDWWIGLLD